jgi:tubulysin polyketide synthase-like protein
MTVLALLHDLTVQGIILSANGDQLDVDAPGDALTDDVLATLRERKGELLMLLNRQPGAVCPVCGGAVEEVRASYYTHVWCQGGHLDSWQALNGRRLNSSGAPIVRQKLNAKLEAGARGRT